VCDGNDKLWDAVCGQSSSLKTGGMHHRHLQPAWVCISMAFDPPKKRQQPDPTQGTPGPSVGSTSKERVPDTYEDLAAASKTHEGIFGRMGQAFQDVLQSSRGDRRRAPADEAGDDPSVTADDLAIRRAKSVKMQRMIVPEGVIIDGSMSSGSETEISGRIEGNVTVDGRLYLSASALVTGNVRATSCKVEGLVEGKMECSQELELGQTGRLNADALGGKGMVVCGQIFGNVSSGGVVRLAPTAKVTGDIRTRRLIVEEGAVFNGACRMRPPAQKGAEPSAEQKK